jgi:hypothetical protein
LEFRWNSFSGKLIARETGHAFMKDVTAKRCVRDSVQSPKPQPNSKAVDGTDWCQNNSKQKEAPLALNKRTANVLAYGGDNHDGKNNAAHLLREVGGAHFAPFQPTAPHVAVDTRASRSFPQLRIYALI